ncbi:hypothetical protein SESBI_43610 [Sesbania bispinosa]|nr:hypothetical protein SESBI_43610 [Sesbania bispinosa]
MSENIDPVVNESSVVLTRTSVLLSPESLTPFRTLVRSRFLEDFKPYYFRLRGTEGTSELLFNSQGDPKFPLYWTKNQNRLKALKESSLTVLELLDVKLLTSFRSVDCNVLIEKEGDAGALQPFIVEMSSQNEGFVPKMDAKAMKAFSRTNKRKQGSQASGPMLVTETEHEVSSPTISDKLVSKKTCPNRGEVSSSHPSAPNMENPQPLAEEVSKAKEVLSEMESLRENFRKLNLEKEKVEGKLADLKNEKVKSDDLLAEKTKLLEAAEEKLLAEKKEHREEVNNLKAEITFQYEQGFKKAVDQVKFLHPEIVIDEVGAFKEIRDGKLVDIPDDEE